MNRRILIRRGALCTIVLLCALQFVRPGLKDPPHEALFQSAVVPPPVASVFERACQDCHSNNTRWPWYARVAPVSLLVGKDVRKGREFLNMSEWHTYNKGAKLGYLSSMAEATRNRKMPPPMYSAIHADARLTQAERKLISVWAHEERNRLREPPR